MTLARALYTAHAAVVVTLGLLAVFGRSRQLAVVSLLFLLGFVLSIAIAVLTALRRKGFGVRATAFVFVAAVMMAIVVVAAHEVWMGRHWSRSQDCLQRLANSLATQFDDLGGSTVVFLDAHRGSSLAHPRSREFARQLSACGLSRVSITRDQMEFVLDEVGVTSRPGGYVFRHREGSQLAHCPYVLTGRDDEPGRLLKERWYYCRG